MANEQELAVVLKLVADQFKSELKKSGGMVGEFSSFIGDWKTQLVAAGTAMFAITKSTANYGDELVKMSQRLGLSIQETARWQHAAKLADTDLMGLSSTVGLLAKEMVQAASGSDESEKRFQRLGLSVRGASGELKGTTDILLEISDRFRAMPDGPQKTGEAMLLLGKNAKEVLPLLNSDLRQAFTETRQLGLEMSDQAAKRAEQFNDQLTKLQGAIRGISNDVGTALMPAFDGFARMLTTILTDLRSVTKELAGLNRMEMPQVGVVQPEGGRRLRIMPSPSAEAVKGLTTTPFFRTEEEAKEYEKERAAEEKGLGVWIFQRDKIKREAEAERKRLAGIEQEGLGRWIVQREQLRQAEEAQKQKFLDAEQEALGRWIVQKEQLRQADAAEQERLEGLEQEALGRLIVARTQQQLEASKTFFDGWREGMQKYVKDTQSGFGMAADMARRTFQTMEQGASRFFFDVMSGKITSLKDGFRSLLQFAQQIVAQIASQLIIRNLAGALIGDGSSGTGGLLGKWLSSTSSGFGSGAAANKWFGGFASGGAFRVGGFGGTDSQMVAFRASPDETVSVTRPDQRAGAASVSIVINNMGQNDVQAQAEQGQDGRMMVYITVRDMVKGMISGGEMDKPFRNRFNLSPAVGGRG